MSEQLFIFILLIHFLADFGLQTNEQATLKSSSFKWLFYHVGVYSLIWFFCSFIVFGDFLLCFYFALITFCAHYLTDFATSRIGKPFWDKKDLHNGFVVTGFDQILHYLQLYYTFKFLLGL